MPIVTPVRLLAIACGAMCLLAVLAAGARADLRLGARAPFAPLANPVGPAGLAAAAVPSGFQESVAMSGLNYPTAIRFAPDGRVFVAEKSGMVKVFDSIDDPTATIYADLEDEVYDFWDRGLLGLELDPQFTTGRPFVYVAYSRDAPVGGSSPTWRDNCPTPPGPTDDGCVVGSRLSRLTGGVEQVLIEDWCQQYSSHTVGSLAFGADGALYMTAGDGANFDIADYGQKGRPLNPCGDPPGAVGATLTPPTAEGGALRSQDVRTTADPTGLDGTMLRLNPDTGAAMPDNPNAQSADPNTRRIVGYGLRNAFRFAIRPGTNDIYLGDVGWLDWEEINRLPSPAAPVENFGWPCYEGAGRQSSYDNLNLNLCESLYSAGGVTPPLYTYNHTAKVSTESCPVGGSSLSGMAFYDGGTFPSQYNGALFFADYSRECIWVMFAGAGGVPDPATRQPFITGAAGPIDLQVGPGGDLFYVDLNGGTIRRVHAIQGNRGPTADAVATPATGAIPLNVSFDGTGSSDPDGQPLSYAWDLDGDGAYDDSTASKPTFTYTTGGTYTVRLRVTDPRGLTSSDSVTITAGSPPTASIDTPTSQTTWKVGDVIDFSGSAVDGQGNPVPASGLSWRLVLQHCAIQDPTSCHQHPVTTYTGAAGSFTAPEHEYPVYLELTLTATSGGLTDSVTRRLDPKTVELTFETQPTGLELSVGGSQGTASFTRTVVQGAGVSLIAPTPQALGGKTYEFASWSDGGAVTHSVIAPTTPATYRATYAEASCAPPTGGAPVGAWGFDEASGTAVADASGRGNAGVITGATRTAGGKFGSALTFDGVNDWVTVADSASLDLTTRATLEAWVHPTASGAAWRTAMLKERPGQLAYALYANSDTNRPSSHLYTASELIANGTAALPVNVWSHLAMTWDGGVQRLFLNGTQVASGAATGTLVNASGPLRFGGNGVWSEWFAGRLDEIRVYDRALTQAQLQTDMTTPVTCSGGPPPPQPALAVSKTALAFTATQGGAAPAPQGFDVTNTGGGTLDFTAGEPAPWLTVSPAAATAPGTVTATPSIPGLAPGTYTTAITVAAAGATGSPKTVDVTLTVNAATPVLAVAPATLAFSASQGGANPPAQTVNVTNTGGGTLSFTATDDQPWLSVTPASGSAPSALSVSATVAGLAAGTYTGALTITAAGATGSPKSVAVTLSVGGAPPPGGAPVGAWGFDEASGAAVADASGRGNGGVIAGATRTAAGKFGAALTFDGVNDWVTVADSASLDLTTRATIGAWVYPTSLAGRWRTAVLKERPGQLAYALYANSDTNRPSSHLYTASELIVNGTAALPVSTWSHLAMTWDGGVQRLFINGTQVASGAATGTLVNGSGPLRFGGNGVWSEWFAGRLDEIRVYDRALTQAQLQTDMATPVTGAG